MQKRCIFPPMIYEVIPYSQLSLFGGCSVVQTYSIILTSVEFTPCIT